ncbi:MAG: hypothetical protein ABIQ74_02570 [Chitinophagales bacterium]
MEDADAYIKAEDERRRVERETKKEVVRDNINTYVVLTGRSSPKNLGGYNWFSVTIENKSDYLIDQYSVQIQVWQENGALYRTNKAEIYNIMPHTRKRVKVDGSGRGSKWNFYRPRIRSETLGL